MWTTAKKIAKSELKKKNSHLYTLERKDGMHVEGRVYISPKLYEILDDDSVTQVRNVAMLPGIYKASIAMPDVHKGYGFPIGGVAAIDAKKGCISPGGVGFDINCGVRLLTSNLDKEVVAKNIHQILDELFRSIPCGVGGESNIRLTDEQLDAVLSRGARWAVEQKYGNEDDLEHCESNGELSQAKPSKVTVRAKARGRKQLGTLGAGNHFLEVQYVDEIFDKEVAKAFGITKKSQVTVMIHCGSRGLGHQVCTDFLRRMEEEDPKLMASLPEKDLIYAKAGSKTAEDYFQAMCASANYAWANRHIIAHQARVAFKNVLPETELKTLYDVAHNIAKLEEHDIDGKKVKVYVHRKGATRAFPPHHKEIPKKYQPVGQPILIPGSMGTASYVLVGTEKAMQETFGSTAHGAGRTMGRFEAMRKFNPDDVKAGLDRQKIAIKAASKKGIVEESPDCYKDVDEVVKVSHDAGIGNLVVRLKPIGVIKG